MVTWKILDIIRNVATGGIVEALVECVGAEDEVVGSVRAKASFVANADSPDFVPFDQLTEDMVINWAKDALGEAVMETKVAAAIEAQKKIMFANGLPWSAQ